MISDYHALYPPQSSEAEQPGTHADKVADGSAHMQEQGDGIDGHDSFSLCLDIALLLQGWRGFTALSL